MTSTEKLLKSENAGLKREIVTLKKVIAGHLERLNSAKPFTGGAVENYIRKLVGGEFTIKNSAYDIRAADGARIEVKFSRLNIPHAKAEAYRWQWGHPLGSGGKKRFDRLILVGETDPLYRRAYCDPRSKYVLFDVPFRSVQRLMRKDAIIQIGTNPEVTLSETGRELFRRFHVTRLQLEERYRRLETLS